VYEMKNSFCRVLLILIIFAIDVSYFLNNRHDFRAVSCIDELPARELAYRAAMSDMKTLKNELGTEDIAMHLVYQLARRNIVKVTAKNSAGSGIIWRIDNEITIVSNKHLLMNDVSANITFCNGEEAVAEVIGYSQQYDIGFVKVDGSYMTDKLLRDIYEAYPVIFHSETQLDKDTFAEKYQDARIMQVGVDLDNVIVDYSVGNAKELKFLPLFNTNVIVSRCYAKAGMSGGGIFDSDGRLLGMISGGEVSDDSSKKESDITYSIPAGLIQTEYELLING
jgi:hypothetical protein